MGRFDLMSGTLLVVVLDVDDEVEAPAVPPARFKPDAIEVPPCLAALIGDKVGPLIVKTFGSWLTLVIDDEEAAVSVLEGVAVPFVGAAAPG